MMVGNGHASVPPGFRFHPTDEELLYYYLRKKVSYEAIDLDVIREVDLNKLEPWDLKEKCRIGSGPQNEWYFFSHKDKKYPTGTRTNRATTAGFWKATGRDKAIYMSNTKRIGMRKTLVFYTGRAPHGHKTDWIMHEYRLDDDDNPNLQQEDGWVVCRVFKKKNHGRGLQQDLHQDDDYDNIPSNYTTTAAAAAAKHLGSSNIGIQPPPPRQHQHQHQHQNYTTQPFIFSNNFTQTLDTTMHLPHLSSQENPTPNSAGLINTMDHLLRLTSGGSHHLGGMFSNAQLLLAGANDRLVNGGGGGGGGGGGEWGFLDKLLTNYQSMEAQQQQQQQQQDPHEIVGTSTTSNNENVAIESSNNKFPFQYLGSSDQDWLKFAK